MRSDGRNRNANRIPTGGNLTSTPKLNSEQLAAQLAEKLVRDICFTGECPPEMIGPIALAVIACPVFADATDAQCQYIYDQICGALAARQLARIVAKQARFVH